ncbi:MFS transporter permease [Microbacterium sp. W1N]|uniref:MFS transporter permease n=1 Tax=Microbacterium festucae TaxID=2977531 RepID=UPI0021BEAF55|nr:MFS transporter permease [Microbacterium festucae]MCT9820312.1 MFS transporter permease [Microbacterium festucae]
MWLRRAFFLWLIPAAFVLPLWLVIAWIATGSNPWTLLWVLLSAPIVFVGQLILTLLVRARGTVRTDRAVSWTDVGLMGAWHVLIIALGFFDNPAWWAVFGLTMAVGVALLWMGFRQLWLEARGSVAVVRRTSEGVAYIPPQQQAPRRDADPGVFIITERDDQR